MKLYRYSCKRVCDNETNILKEEFILIYFKHIYLSYTSLVDLHHHRNHHNHTHLDFYLPFPLPLPFTLHHHLTFSTL